MVTEMIDEGSHSESPGPTSRSASSTNAPAQAEDISLRRIRADVQLGDGVIIRDFVNLYGCTVGEGTRIGTFVEIQKGSKIGRNCKISSHTFICEGVTVEDDVFVGHGVMFTNDLYPRATSPNGKLQTDGEWQCLPTLVKRGASIGSGVTLLCGITIGEGAIVGAGSVVTKNVPAHMIVAGNPARALRPTAPNGPVAEQGSDGGKTEKR
jgi:acetyltransferase-like isoleucine patch superfamily enzyme